jgi:predicted MFS family arabinose efflux permease
MAGAVVCSGAGVFVLHEPILDTAQAAAGWLGAMGRRFLAIVRDLWQTVKTKEALTGVVICAAPVGCGALVNLFTALAPDYHAPAEVVGLVNGLGGGLAGALGSVVGGFFADRMNRRLAYAAAGGLTALCALGFYFGPMNATTFTIGSLAYAFANGLAFAAFAGMVLEMVGHSAAVTTKYTLFVAVSNQAISYTTWFDGKASGFRGWGSRGTILADALVTFAGIGLLLAMVALTRRRGTERPNGQTQVRKDG